MQPGVEAQVAGAVDDGLDAHGAAVFEVLLDPRVPVEHVEQDTAVVAAVDRGAEGAQGVAAHPPAEDDFHVVWAAQVEVVHDERLEEAAGVPWCVEDDGAGDLDLAHRGLPPVAGIPVDLVEGQRRSEEHTSELQSRENLVCRLLLEKKKKKK